MSSGFILLEIADPSVAAFLWSVREALSGERLAGGPIHVTLRGPYEGAPPNRAIENVRRQLRHDVLEVAGVGRFSNADDPRRGEVVYFRVNSPHLRKAWWKPSFPIGIHGFEPHISVYRGSDALLAERAAVLLDEARICLRCAEHRVVVHVTGQPSMFRRHVPSVHDVARLVDSTELDFTVVERLRELVERHKATLPARSSHFR